MCVPAAAFRFFKGPTNVYQRRVGCNVSSSDVCLSSIFTGSGSRCVGFLGNTRSIFFFTDFPGLKLADGVRYVGNT